MPLAIAGGFLLCELLLMYTAGRRLSSRLLTWTLQNKGPKRFFGWALMMPGTALHELSHALVVILLGGKIHSFVPFRPVENEDGSFQLGYVEHSEVHLGAIGGALVGMAPLVGVPLAIWGLGLLMLPSGGTPLEMLSWTVANPVSLGPLWLLIAAPLSLGALPSPSDHRHLPLGAAMLAIPLLVLSLAGLVAAQSLLQTPLIGWVQLLLLPSCVACLGFLPRR